jgi:hypothetical protein
MPKHLFGFAKPKKFDLRARRRVSALQGAQGLDGAVTRVLKVIVWARPPLADLRSFAPQLARKSRLNGDLMMIWSSALCGREAKSLDWAALRP